MSIVCAWLWRVQPAEMAPASMPIRKRGPMRKPPMSGARMAYEPGAIISRTEETVEICTQRSELGTTSCCAAAFQFPSPCWSYLAL